MGRKESNQTKVKDILVLNNVKTFDKVMIKLFDLEMFHHRNCHFSSAKGNYSRRLLTISQYVNTITSVIAAKQTA